MKIMPAWSGFFMNKRLKEGIGAGKNLGGGGRLIMIC